MPCYEIKTVSVEFKVAHRDLLVKALDALARDSVGSEAMGWRQDWNGAKTFCRLANGIELDLRIGKASMQASQQANLNALKRTYSQQCVKLAAKLNGWQLSPTKNELKGQLVRGAL